MTQTDHKDPMTRSIRNLPKRKWVWGLSPITGMYSFGLMWKKSENEYARLGDEIYRRHVVVAFNPSAWRALVHCLKQVFSWSLR